MSDYLHSEGSLCSAAAEPPKRHERFYLPDGNIIIQVENTLYNIHRYFFIKHSPVFEGMFALPASTEGSSDENPIHLQGVETIDFDQLVSLFYPTDLCHYGDGKNIKKWMSILDLSRKWELNNIRELAIEKLYPITTAVDRVVIGHKYNINGWLLPAYTILCAQEDAISYEDGLRLGLRDVIRINQIRNDFYSPSGKRKLDLGRALEVVLERFTELQVKKD